MSEFPEFPPVPTKRHNPFPLILRPNDEKYIPPDIVEKFDYVMKHEDQFDIPLDYVWHIGCFARFQAEELRY